MSLAPLFAISIYWHLPILIFVVSLVYSATRFEQWGSILRETMRWAFRLTAFLAVVGIILYVVVAMT